MVKTAVTLVATVWGFGLTMALGFAEASPPPIPFCQEEDGSDVVGQCIWVDPDTGDMYLNPAEK